LLQACPSSFYHIGVKVPDPEHSECELLMDIEENTRATKATYYRSRDGCRIRALLVGDTFETEMQGDNGCYTGSRLYLTEHGEWLELDRDGSFSRWEDVVQSWDCGVNSVPEEDWVLEAPHGSMQVLTDQGVIESGWPLRDLLIQLSKTMTEFTVKMQQKESKLAARAELATAVITALAK
jgi:hypothetical protein